MRWQYTDTGAGEGGSLDSKPPATEVDREHIFFALRMFTIKFSIHVLCNPAGLENILETVEKMSYYINITSIFKLIKKI